MDNPGYDGTDFTGGASATVACYKEGVLVYSSPVFATDVISKVPKLVDVGAMVFTADAPYVKEHDMVINVTEIAARELDTTNQYGVSINRNLPPNISSLEQLDNIAVMIGMPTSKDNVWDYTRDRGARCDSPTATGIVSDMGNIPYSSGKPYDFSSIDPNFDNVNVLTTIVARGDVCIQTDPTADETYYNKKIVVPGNLISPRITLKNGHFSLKFQKLVSVVKQPSNYIESCVCDGEFEAATMDDIREFCNKYPYVLKYLLGQ